MIRKSDKKFGKNRKKFEIKLKKIIKKKFEKNDKKRLKKMMMKKV